MKKQTFTACVLWMVMVVGCSGTPQQRYEPNWESLKRHECPVWFQDAKFGIYFHWGPYSVPAYKTEWYSHYMLSQGMRAMRTI